MAKDLKVHFSSNKSGWETPNYLFNYYDDIYQFILDAAADERNHKCDDWFGPGGIHEDALTVSWQPWLEKGNIWLNPPYSRGLQKKFVEKAANESTTLDTRPAITKHFVVCLLPARTDTKIFHEIIKPYSSSIEFLKGRVKFVGAEHGAPFPSLICVF